LFSLGAILYEMCAGQPPFQGNSALAILRQITEAKHRPIRELNPDIPDWLAEVVDDLLAKKPADRYQTAADLAEVLEFHWAHMRSSSAKLPAVCQVELQKRDSRNRMIFAGVGAALLTIGLTAGLFLPRTGNHPPAAVSAAEPIAVLAAESGSVWSLGFDPDSEHAAMAVEDGSVRLWDLKSQSVQSTLDAHRGVVWSTQFFNAGQMLATAGDDGLLKIWSIATLEPVRTFEHPNAVRGLAIGSDQRLFAGDRKGGLHVWSIDSSAPLVEAQQPGAIYALAISPDGKTLASAGSDKTIRLWNPDSLKQRLSLEGHAGPVYGLSFSRDSAHLASAGWDGTIRTWDVAKGKLRHSWNGQSGDIWSIAFSPAADLLATGGTDGSVRIWQADTGELLKTFLGHKTTVHTVSFNGDGSLLGSGGRDGAARVWPMK
jgi:hypothetical protein